MGQTAGFVAGPWIVRQSPRGVAPIAFLFFCFIGVLTFFKGKRKTRLPGQRNGIGSLQNPSWKQSEGFGSIAKAGVPQDGWSFSGVEESRATEWSLAILISLCSGGHVALVL